MSELIINDKLEKEGFLKIHGIIKEQVEDYIPEKMVFKHNDCREWQVSTILGNFFPCVFKTKEKAIQQAKEHKDLLQDYFDNPEKWGFYAYPKNKSFREDLLRRAGNLISMGRGILDGFSISIIEDGIREVKELDEWHILIHNIPRLEMEFQRNKKEKKRNKNEVRK